MKKLLLTLFALTASISAMHAQDGRTVEFRTLCLEQIEGLEKVILPSSKDPSAIQEVALYKDVSPVVKGFFEAGEAVFYTEKLGPAGKPLRVPVGKAVLGKSSRQLFLFVPGSGKEGELPYQVQAYDDDLAYFALGSIRAINLAPVPVRFVISGETTPQVPSGKYAQFPHSKKVDPYNMYPVAVEFQSANGAWVKGQSVSWKATRSRREIVVTTVDMKYKQPSVLTFTDFPPWAAP